MWGKVKFSECPMYHRSKHNGTKLDDLDLEIKDVQKTVNKIELEHSINMQSTVAMKEKIVELTQSVESLMEDEAEHHQTTSHAVESLAVSVNNLIGIQEKQRLDREARELQAIKDSKEWKQWWMKIGGTVVTVVILGIGTMLYNTWKYGNELQHAKIMQESILSNQEKVLTENSLVGNKR